MYASEMLRKFVVLKMQFWLYDYMGPLGNGRSNPLSTLIISCAKAQLNIFIAYKNSMAYIRIPEHIMLKHSVLIIVLF